MDFTISTTLFNYKSGAREGEAGFVIRCISDTDTTRDEITIFGNMEDQPSHIQTGIKNLSHSSRTSNGLVLNKAGKRWEVAIDDALLSPVGKREKTEYSNGLEAQAYEPTEDAEDVITASLVAQFNEAGILV